MSDTGQPPEKRVFEPPPWEREQFDELARKRAEAQRADEAVDELLQPAPRHEPADDEEHVEETPAPPGIDERRIEAMLVQLSGEEPSSMAPIRTASRVIAGVVAAVGLAIVIIAAVIAGRGSDSGAIATTTAGVGAAIGAALIGVGAWLWVRAKR